LANQNADLGELLAEPREALDVEVKQWLDLTVNDHRALVAKETIDLDAAAPIASSNPRQD
jgi:hypothetical protein